MTELLKNTPPSQDVASSPLAISFEDDPRVVKEAATEDRAGCKVLICRSNGVWCGSGCRSWVAWFGAGMPGFTLGRHSRLITVRS